MRVFVDAKYTKDKVYSAYVFLDEKNRVVKHGVICNAKTSNKYIGYLYGLQKALHMICRGEIVADEFIIMCDSADVLNWFEGGDLKVVPKRYRTLFTEIQQSCMYSPVRLSIVKNYGNNYAKKYATVENYKLMEEEKIDGVNVLDFFKDM